MRDENVRIGGEKAIEWPKKKEHQQSIKDERQEWKVGGAADCGVTNAQAV